MMKSSFNHADELTSYETPGPLLREGGMLAKRVGSAAKRRLCMPCGERRARVEYKPLKGFERLTPGMLREDHRRGASQLARMVLRHNARAGYGLPDRPSAQ
jgi:hypothetical protein